MTDKDYYNNSENILLIFPLGLLFQSIRNFSKTFNRPMLKPSTNLGMLGKLDTIHPKWQSRFSLSSIKIRKEKEKTPSIEECNREAKRF